MTLGATRDRREDVCDLRHFIPGKIAQPRIFHRRQRASLTGMRVMEGHEYPIRGPPDIELDIVGFRRDSVSVNVDGAALRAHGMVSVRGYFDLVTGHVTIRAGGFRPARRVAIRTVSHAPARVTTTQVTQATSTPAMTSRKKWFPVATTTSVVARG